MDRVDKTRFLNNIVRAEEWIYGNIFLSGEVLDEKRRVLGMVAKTSVCGAFFGEDMSEYRGNKKKFLLRGVGSLISDLRKRGVEDDLIYDVIDLSRKKYLFEKNIRCNEPRFCYEALSARDKRLDFYNFVYEALGDCLP